MFATMQALALGMERLARFVGWCAACLNVLLLAVIIVQVTLRYLVSGGHQIMLGELEWHLYAAAMMFGLAYSQVYNAHVRVDALSRRFSARARSWVEVLGIVFLMFPFLGIMIVQGADYVAVAWRVNESSDSPVGLPWRWIIKSVIPAAFVMLTLALLARLLREVAFLAGAKEPPAQYAERFARFRPQVAEGGGDGDNKPAGQ